VKLARFRKTKVTCFLSYVEDRSKYNYMHYHIYIHKHIYILHIYIWNMFLKVELLEETKRGGKEEKNDRE
jgi:hypothetical protein